MKKNIITIIMCSIIFTLHSQEKATLTVHLDEEASSVEQWVYLFSQYGNQYCLQDSVYISKGEKTIKLSAKCHVIDEMLSISFEKKGADKGMLFLSNGDEVNVYIDNRKKAVCDSPAMKESNSNFKEFKKIIEKLKPLKEQRATEKDSIKLVIINDSIDKLLKYQRYGLSLELLKTIKYPLNYWLRLLVLEKYISAYQLDSLILEGQKKFPNYERIKYFKGGKEYAPRTEESKRIHKRKMAIYYKRRNMFPPSRPKKKVVDYDTIQADKYKIGDKVKNIILPDENGKNKSLYDIKTDYIFIDFWASWCSPCRRDIKFSVLKTYNKFKNVLSVYAITIDENNNNWKQAIKIDKSEVFTQVTLNNNKDEYKIKKQFNVKAIPKNFLLDKDHRIIAINLHGDDLYYKIMELANKK